MYRYSKQVLFLSLCFGWRDDETPMPVCLDPAQTSDIHPHLHSISDKQHTYIITYGTRHTYRQTDRQTSSQQGFGAASITSKTQRKDEDESQNETETKNTLALCLYRLSFVPVGTSFRFRFHRLLLLLLRLGSQTRRERKQAKSLHN